MALRVIAARWIDRVSCDRSCVDVLGTSAAKQRRRPRANMSDIKFKVEIIKGCDHTSLLSRLFKECGARLRVKQVAVYRRLSLRIG